MTVSWFGRTPNFLGIDLSSPISSSASRNAVFIIVSSSISNLPPGNAIWPGWFFRCAALFVSKSDGWFCSEQHMPTRTPALLSFLSLAKVLIGFRSKSDR